MSNIALTVSILALVAVLGLWIGSWKIRGVGLGIGGVLFGGIIVGHFTDNYQIVLDSNMLHFIQEFGLILFVYTIGIQVGPGFFSSLRRSGLRLNGFACLLVLLGCLVTAGLHKIFDIPLPIILGIFSGAVTNTPSLGAGQQVLTDLHANGQLIDQMGMAYAMAYPFGICGILFVMWTIRLIFKINIDKEAKAFDQQSGAAADNLQTINIQVCNTNLNGLQLQDIPIISDEGVICSRLKRDNLLMVPSSSTIIQMGDLCTLSVTGIY